MISTELANHARIKMYLYPHGYTRVAPIPENTSEQWIPIAKPQRSRPLQEFLPDIAGDLRIVLPPITANHDVFAGAVRIDTLLSLLLTRSA
jgi:hypothetical protein